MPIHPRGAALPQDLHGLLGALGAGFDKDELAIVIERHGVGLDHVGRQVIIGKMGFKGLNNGVLAVLAPLRQRSGFDIAPKHRRSRARRKDRTDVARLSRHDGLIVNSVFKSRASQSLYGFVQVPGVVEYPNDGRHLHTAVFHTCGSGDSGIGRQSWQEDSCSLEKNTIDAGTITIGGRLIFRPWEKATFVIFALPLIGIHRKNAKVLDSRCG
jgi:hypothetical protein